MLPNLYRHSRRINGKVKGFLPLSQSGFSFPLFFFLFCCVVGGVFVFHSFLPFDFLFSISSCCHLLVLFVISYFMFAYSNFQKKKKMNENKDQ